MQALSHAVTRGVTTASGAHTRTPQQAGVLLTRRTRVAHLAKRTGRTPTRQRDDTAHFTHRALTRRAQSTDSTTLHGAHPEHTWCKCTPLVQVHRGCTQMHLHLGAQPKAVHRRCTAPRCTTQGCAPTPSVHGVERAPRFRCAPCPHASHRSYRRPVTAAFRGPWHLTELEVRKCDNITQTEYIS